MATPTRSEHERVIERTFSTAYGWIPSIGIAGYCRSPETSPATPADTRAIAVAIPAAVNTIKSALFLSILSQLSATPLPRETAALPTVAKRQKRGQSMLQEGSNIILPESDTGWDPPPMRPMQRTRHGSQMV